MMKSVIRNMLQIQTHTQMTNQPTAWQSQNVWLLKNRFQIIAWTRVIPQSNQPLQREAEEEEEEGQISALCARKSFSK